MADSSPPMSPVAPAPGSKRPADTAFKQQRLPAWQPVMSPRYVIGCFFAVALIFIPIGIAIIVASDQIVEISIRYDHLQQCNFNQRSAVYGYACTPQNFSFTVPETMKAPVFMFYRIDNFYQNHRRYARSRSELQLAGEPIFDASQLADCKPFATPGEFTDLSQKNTTVEFVNSSAGRVVNLRDVTYYPCGLIAWSMFNDTFILSRDDANGSTLVCNGEAFSEAGDPLLPMQCTKKGIAWPSDIGTKFTSPSAAALDRSLTYKGWPLAANTSELSIFVQRGWYIGEVGHKIPSPIDEDLMVWMRLASLSDFQKLYRRINTDLPPGTYFLTFLQRFAIDDFGGKKYFVLSTSSWIGGKNYFLGGLYIATGCVCLILACAFIAKFMTTAHRIGGI